MPWGGVAPKFAFDSKLQSLNLNYKRLLESLKVRGKKKDQGRVALVRNSPRLEAIAQPIP